MAVLAHSSSAALISFGIHYSQLALLDKEVAFDFVEVPRCEVPNEARSHEREFGAVSANGKVPVVGGQDDSRVGHDNPILPINARLASADDPIKTFPLRGISGSITAKRRAH